MTTPEGPTDRPALSDFAEENVRVAAITARREAATLRAALEAERLRTRQLGAALADATTARDDAWRRLTDAEQRLDALRSEHEATLRRRSVRMVSAVTRLLRPGTRPEADGRK